MKWILCTLALIVYGSSNAQKSLDTRIFVTVTDTTGLRERVRLAFVEEDFQVKDNNRKDTLSTLPYNVRSSTFIISFAAIKGNTVEFWGFLADANTNMMGITVNPTKNDYKKIFYYKRDKYWRKLMAVAGRIGSDFTYGRQGGVPSGM